MQDAQDAQDENIGYEVGKWYLVEIGYQISILPPEVWHIHTLKFGGESFGLKQESD